MRCKKGFTLLEVLVVIIILAVLATIAQPIYVRRRIRTEYDSALAQVQTIAAAQRTYAIGWEYMPSTFNTADTNNVLAINIRDGSFHNYRITRLSDTDFQVQVDYTRAGNTITYTFDKDGNQLSCVPASPDCMP